MLNGTSIARLLYWSFCEWTYFYILPFFSLKPETKNTKFITFLRYLCEKHAFQKKLWQSCLNFKKKTRDFNIKSWLFFIKNAEIRSISFLHTVSKKVSILQFAMEISRFKMHIWSFKIGIFNCISYFDKLF